MTIDERFEYIQKNIESLHEAVFENTRQIAELRAIVAQDAENIRALARIAEIHGHRRY